MKRIICNASLLFISIFFIPTLASAELDHSWWSTGTLDYDNGIIQVVSNSPVNPESVAFGKSNVAVKKGKKYIFSADLSASPGAMKIEILLRQEGGSWTVYSERKTITVSSSQPSTHTVELISSYDDPNATFVANCGFSSGTLAASSVSLVESADPPVATYPLDNNWWATDSGQINYATGIVIMDINSLPAQPYEQAFGRNNTPADPKRFYRLKFSASADLDNVKVTVRFRKGIAPWTEYDNTYEIRLGLVPKDYEIVFRPDTLDPQATLVFDCGYEVAKLNFSKIELKSYKKGASTPAINLLLLQ